MGRVTASRRHMLPTQTETSIVSPTVRLMRIVGVESRFSRLLGRQALRGARAALNLLQAQLFSCCQQSNRFAEAIFARFRSLGRMNPSHEMTPVGRRQPLKEGPC